jgi:hypothetical protein
MATYKFRSLPYDVARCRGTNCRVKETCARFLQIELDKASEDRNNWVVYTDSPRSGDECEIRRGVDL